jgi:hypothetical protein
VKAGTPTPEAAADQLSGLTGSTAVFDEETEADGWKRYSSADEGFAISLPDSWQRIDVDNEEVLMEGLRAIDPSLVETLGERLRSQLGGAMRFFALDSGNARAGSLAANINVLRQPLAERLDLETVIRQAVRGLQSIDSIQGEIKSETIKLRNGEVGMLTYTLNVSGANGKSVPTVIRQYIIGTDSHLLVITFGVSEDQAGEYAATFDDIASRFEVLP